ncbi:MAG: PAS domain S-box protein [Proteobacteria bacterium]|nr:PAS domain S-box protein [Pseudomonadota bacterium]MBU1585809.1 PAS domain S-box protein [Pseudomonadota bacterium]MBU2627226.1 PAS domain S-box protein [Pseudomonadota bacterium]
MKLHEGLEKYRDVARNIPGMIYRGKSDWSTQILVNSEKICGYHVDEFETQQIKWIDLIHSEDAHRVFEESARLSESPMSIVQEYRIISKDGSMRWVRDHKTSFFEEDGSFSCVDGIVYDITDRKLLEKELKQHSDHLEALVDERTAEIRKTHQALKQSEHRYRNLVNTMQEGLVEVDSNWQMKFVNDKFAQMTGHNRDKLVGRYFQDFVDEKYLKKAQKQLSLRHQMKSSAYELQLVRSDGKKIYVRCSPKPLYDPEGKYLGGFSVVSNITESKSREKEREKLIKELQEALDSIKTLSGLVPICSSCKKIRDDRGYWNQLEAYIEKHSEASFSHGMCPQCSEKLYGNEDWYIEMMNDKKK